MFNPLIINARFALSEKKYIFGVENCPSVFMKVKHFTGEARYVWTKSVSEMNALFTKYIFGVIKSPENSVCKHSDFKGLGCF